MKRKLLSLLVLLMTAATGAWADHLYLEVSSTTATLKYGDPGSNPYYDADDSNWTAGADAFKSSVTTIDVDGSCRNFNGTTLKNLFRGWSSLTTINDIGNLKTDNVKNMSYMFRDCYALTTLDLSGWKTSQVEDMSYMFYGCLNLETLNANGWNTSKVDNMYYMFYCCRKLETLDLSGWKTSRVDDMSYMFFGCMNLTTIYVGDKWKATSNSNFMFMNCSHLPNFNSSYTDYTKAYVLSDGYLTAITVNLTANQGDTGEYWATFYNTQGNYQAPEGTQVFKVALAGTTLTMTEIADGIVNKGEGVVLKKTTSGSITLTATIATADYSGNSLQGTTTSITNPGNAYVLNKKAAGVGFYKLSATGTIGANKAYLIYDGSGAREFFGLEETTGIEDINRETITNNRYYDLQGRRVENPTNGIYIVNGKKVVIK